MESLNNISNLLYTEVVSRIGYHSQVLTIGSHDNGNRSRSSSTDTIHIPFPFDGFDYEMNTHRYYVEF